MKIARYLWTIASFYLLVIGFFYMVVLKDAPATSPERHAFVLENWSAYDYQWIHWANTEKSIV